MPLKIAIIGCGRIGERHAKHASTYGKLEAVCDIDLSKAKALSKYYTGVRVYENIDDLLESEKIEIVAICTPNGFHAEHTIKALNAGFHVLCEKPMAISVHDCGEMIKVAEKNNRRLFAVKQNRFNPPVVALKQAIEDGVLGDIYSIQLSCFWNRNFEYYDGSWRGSKKLDGGTLFTQFSHFIDLLYWLVGDVKKVHAITANFAHQGVIEFEDTGVVALEFYSGAIGTINYTVNSYGKNMEGSLTVFAEKGTVKIGGQYLNELEYQNIENYKIESVTECSKANDYGEYQGSMSNHDLVYENVVNVLRKNEAISTSAFEGLKTVEFIDKIYTSAKSNGV